MEEMFLDKKRRLCYTMLNLGSSRRKKRYKVNIMKRKFLALYEMTRLMEKSVSFFWNKKVRRNKI